jgi:hypothetical protein
VNNQLEDGLVYSGHFRDCQNLVKRIDLSCPAVADSFEDCATCRGSVDIGQFPSAHRLVVVLLVETQWSIGGSPPLWVHLP